MRLACKVWAIMATITLSPKPKFTAFICRESIEKGLHEFPDKRSSGDRRGGFVVAITEASTDGLVHVEHVLELGGFSLILAVLLLKSEWVSQHTA